MARPLSALPPASSPSQPGYPDIGMLITMGRPNPAANNPALFDIKPPPGFVLCVRSATYTITDTTAAPSINLCAIEFDGTNLTIPSPMEASNVQVMTWFDNGRYLQYPIAFATPGFNTAPLPMIWFDKQIRVKLTNSSAGFTITTAFVTYELRPSTRYW